MSGEKTLEKDTSAVLSTARPEAPKPKKKKFNKRRLIKPLIWVLVLAIIAVVVILFMNQARNTISNADTEEIYTVGRGALQISITGSGVMEPIDKRDIVPLVSKGKILTAPFEEGDIIQEGALLYTFDSSSLENSIQQSRNAIETANIANRSNYTAMKDWNIVATASGRVTNFKTASGAELKAGDSINTGTKICDIINDDILHINIPFSESQLANIYIGQTAQLTSAQYMTSGLYGTVSDINSAPVRGKDGTVLYNIEITMNNPGAITSGMSFTANIDGMVSPASGTADVSANEPVSAKTGGTVAAVYVKEGDYVTQGTVLVKLKNDTVTDAIERSSIELENSRLSLESKIKELEDYSITAPITGTVITKTSKAGDTLGVSSNASVLATIADMSKMKFTMEIDELDIAKIQMGQAVDVTADALKGVNFAGSITQIMQEGVSTNGVTVYNVEVTIDQPGDLKIGMNVNATVVVEQKTDVVKVPIEAITEANGKSYVRVVPVDEKAESRTGASGGNTPSNENMPNKGIPSDKSASSDGMRGGASTADASAANTRNHMVKNAKQGELREVVTGISSRDETEIVSGLNAGEQIYIPNVGSSSAIQKMMTNTGGMNGGMPAGGMSGGTPAGGGRSGGGNTVMIR